MNPLTCAIEWKVAVDWYFRFVILMNPQNQYKFECEIISTWNLLDAAVIHGGSIGSEGVAKESERNLTKRQMLITKGYASEWNTFKKLTSGQDHMWS